jgi:hypothetical protein
MKSPSKTSALLDRDEAHEEGLGSAAPGYGDVNKQRESDSGDRE